MKLHSSLLILSIIFLASCTEQEIGSSKDVNPDAVYIKYDISYEESDDLIECRAQFRFGGAKGTTLILSSPSKVSLDGKDIKVDSSKPLGAYYKVGGQFATFGGEHTWSFTGVNNKIFKNIFSFTPFTLANPIPATIPKYDLVLEFKGLKDGSPLHIEISDTSSADDIDTIYSVTNNRITIAASDLKRLKNGAIEIDIYQNISAPLKEATPEGGELEITYALKRRKAILTGSAAL